MLGTVLSTAGVQGQEPGERGGVRDWGQAGLPGRRAVREWGPVCVDGGHPPRGTVGAAARPTACPGLGVGAWPQGPHLGSQGRVPTASGLTCKVNPDPGHHWRLEQRPDPVVMPLWERGKGQRCLSGCLCPCVCSCEHLCACVCTCVCVCLREGGGRSPHQIPAGAWFGASAAQCRVRGKLGSERPGRLGARTG